MSTAWCRQHMPSWYGLAFMDPLTLLSPALRYSIVIYPTDYGSHAFPFPHPPFFFTVGLFIPGFRDFL